MNLNAKDADKSFKFHLSRTRHEHPRLHQASFGHVRQKTGKDEGSRQNHERCLFSMIVVHDR